MEGTEAIQYIKSIAEKLGQDALAISEDLLKDERFAVWSGSDNPSKHHYGKAGLVIHTAEVMQLGFSTAEVLSMKLDTKEWFFASLFHDAGKIYDYAPVHSTNYQQWQGTEHKRLIHHISRSALIWSEYAGKNPKSNTYVAYHERVLHAILAHHGQREWGSPVAPKTRIAWLLHLCDNLSARMNDCDKVDYLKLRGAA